MYSSHILFALRIINIIINVFFFHFRWFQTLNWDLLYKGKITAPIKPIVSIINIIYIHCISTIYRQYSSEFVFESNIRIFEGIKKKNNLPFRYPRSDCSKMAVKHSYTQHLNSIIFFNYYYLIAFPSPLLKAFWREIKCQKLYRTKFVKHYFFRKFTSLIIEKKINKTCF